MVKRFVCFLFVFSVLVFSLCAANFTNGRIRVTLNEGTGRFSLYYLTNFSPMQFEPLFVDQDPRTSLFTVYYNEKAYKLGENNNFKARLDSSELSPSLIFQSSFLKVTEKFEFIKTNGSSSPNGVKITFIIENIGSRRADVGVRFLLDTNLGEGGNGAPLATNLRSLNGETLFDATSPDQWWVSKNNHLALMGNLGAEGGGRPDIVHVANWKRLHDTPWKLRHSQGRNFTNSSNVGDSAVAYYFDPRRMLTGETVSFSLLLAANASSGFVAHNVMTSSEPPIMDSPSLAQLPSPSFASPPPSASPDPYQSAAPLSPAASPANSARSAALQADMDTLRELLARIDQSINAGFQISDEELIRLEQDIARLRSRYGSPLEPR